MAMKQISVFLENKPGKLEEMTKVLADAGITLRALSVAEAMDFGIVRIIVDDPQKTADVLKEHEFVSSKNHVLAVEIPDVVGGLNKVLAVLAEAKVNLEYMYSTLAGGDGTSAHMILRVENVKEAEEALKKGGFRLLEEFAN